MTDSRSKNPGNRVAINLALLAVQLTDMLHEFLYFAFVSVSRIICSAHQAD